MAIGLSLFLTLFFSIFFTSTFPHPLPVSPPQNNITLFGDASITHTAISLTQPLFACPTTAKFEFRADAAFYSSPICFLDSETKTFVSFLSYFTFSITQLCSAGDDMSFVVASDMDGLNSAKGFMGLPHELSY